MTRQEPEGESKVSRSYSLASAPLRLLSHSFHSTANTHNTNNSHGSSSALAQLPIDHLNTPDALLKEGSIVDLSISTVTPDSHAHLESHNHHHLRQEIRQTVSDNPVPYSTLRRQNDQKSNFTQARPQQRAPQDYCEDALSQATAADAHTASVEHESISVIGSQKKVVKLDTHSDVSAVQAQSHAVHQDMEAKARLENLLMPYDIRYSIFGHLSLQDIYHCQLACKLLYWATSDQLIWKRIALKLIQGEFYFDIPRALPANIPNWKFFCKRHLLRQKNWRRGQVQDVISLDDNYQKLTTLQIMAPYVLTGSDDGRIHLWNINTRTLLHRFQIHGEITWVEHLQEQKIVAGLGYNIDKMESEIRLFSTETGEEIGFYKEDFWDLAICAINGTYLVASDGEGRYTTWNWKTGAKVSHFKVKDESSITEALYLVQNTILELHYDGMIRLFSIHGECYGRFTLDNILPNHQVSFCWFHNDFSMVVWESSNTMAHIRLPLLLQDESSKGLQNNRLDRSISQEEWDAQGAEVYWRHQLEHTCNFAAMGGGRFQLLYVQIFENLMDHVPIRVHSLRHSGRPQGAGADADSDSVIEGGEEGYGWQHGEYVTAHSLNPELEKIIQGLRPSRIDCDPEYIA
ncbi:hypothetical protein BGZ54_002567, partial [Gamsiella multidivaricata]